MSGTTTYPRIWTNADVYSAALGTTAPVDVTTALAAAWLNGALGLLSEDGAKFSRDVDTADHYAWGGILVRTTRSKWKYTVKVTALEDNKVVWPLVNPGSTVSTTTGLTTRITKLPTADVRGFVFQVVDGTNVLRRCIPRGEIIDVAEVTLSDSDMTAYELTINIYPDSVTNVLYTDITNDLQAVVP